MFIFTFLFFILSIFVIVQAAPNSNITLSIVPGVLQTDIMDNNKVPVSAPTVALGNKNFSFDCQNGSNSATGNLGTNTQRVYVINPHAANNGWTLTIAATGSPTALWQNTSATQFFDFNDPTSSGCTDGSDADSRAGQLTIDPSVATITTDCLSCTLSGISLGSSASFNQGVTDSITLINAAAISDDAWRGYATGIGLSQTIPAEQAVDNYYINMTLTVTAI